MKAILALIVLIAASIIGLLLISSHTALQATAPRVIGVSTPVTVHLANPHGVRRVDAYIEQDGRSYPIYQESKPAHRLFFWTGHQPPRSITFEAGKRKAPDLKPGKARVVVETVSNDLRGSTDTAAYDVAVVLAPPSVIPDDAQHYINQGGMELVTFTPGGSTTNSGVRVGNYTFRSFPLPGNPAMRFSMFAYPWDLPPDDTPVVFARNDAGTEATARFWFKLFPKKFRVRDLVIDDAMLQQLVTQVDPTGTLVPGPDYLSRFLIINSEMRRKNNQTLAGLRSKTEEKVLWNGPFLHLGQEESMFADVRNYIYKGKKVDRQVHLGFDLADKANAPVLAANDGRIVWAADLGIYGNCVVVDHGYGLQSIYGHLQRIDVKPAIWCAKASPWGSPVIRA